MITLKTAQKIAIARTVSSVVLGLRRLRGLPAQARVKRGGVWWSLDLTEGIDFSIYLLGGFEPRTLRLYSTLVKPGDTVLDIGANIGAHTLPLAQLVGAGGRVIAFEPTRYAIAKLKANAALNPELKERVCICQAMLVGDSKDGLEREIYSSWPLFSQENQLHPLHGGRLMETQGARALTLDQAFADLNVKRVNFIKLDVDGNEHSVLAGAQGTLRSHHPSILMELSPYLYESAPQKFDELLQMLAGLGYSLKDADSGKVLPLDPVRLRAIIPSGGTRNGLLQQS